MASGWGWVIWKVYWNAHWRRWEIQRVEIVRKERHERWVRHGAMNQPPPLTWWTFHTADHGRYTDLTSMNELHSGFMVSVFRTKLEAERQARRLPIDA